MSDMYVDVVTAKGDTLCSIFPSGIESGDVVTIPNAIDGELEYWMVVEVNPHQIIVTEF